MDGRITSHSGWQSAGMIIMMAGQPEGVPVTVGWGTSGRPMKSYTMTVILEYKIPQLVYDHVSRCRKPGIYLVYIYQDIYIMIYQVYIYLVYIYLVYIYLVYIYQARYCNLIPGLLIIPGNCVIYHIIPA